MNKPLLFLSGIALAFVAQTAPPASPLPARLPNPGHWVRQLESPASPAKKESPSPPVEVSTETWVLGDGRVDHTTFSDQSRTESFLEKGVCFKKSGENIYVSSPGMDPVQKIPSVKQWAEFEWLKPECFAGKTKVAGVECNAFEETTEHGTRRALIEAQTGLPVSLEENARKYLYKFGQPPASLPKPGKEITEAMQRYRKKMAAMTVHRKPR